MKNIQIVTVAMVTALILFCVTAYAGNVVKIVKDEDKTVPQYEETEHNAVLKDFNYSASVAGGGFAQPIGGNVGEFLINDIKLTMTEKKFNDGVIATKELGNVRILFSSSITGAGFIALLTDEQVKKLEKLK